MIPIFPGRKPRASDLPKTTQLVSSSYYICLTPSLVLFLFPAPGVQNQESVRTFNLVGVFPSGMG